MAEQLAGKVALVIGVAQELGVLPRSHLGKLAQMLRSQVGEKSEEKKQKH